MHVLLVGNGQFYQVGAFFRKGLDALEHSYAFVDEAPYLKSLGTSYLNKIAYRLLGRRPLTYWAFNQAIVQAARQLRPDVVLIIKGQYVSPRALERIKHDTGAVLINYATDDPFNPVNSTRDLLEAISFYDLYVCTKRAIMEDVRMAGCPNVVFIPFGYEPDLHFPDSPASEIDLKRFGSDVVFAGGADIDRFPILRTISEMPVRLHLYGGYWAKDKQLSPYHRGYAIGRDYRLALSGAKIALCLVRRANRDGHVMRTFEIPACRGFMMAERTAEHLELFEEDKEAVYFDCDDELKEKVSYYLRNPDIREKISEYGYRKVITSHFTYKDRLNEIINAYREI